MTIETNFNYPSDLNASLPAAGDTLTEGDDHIRGVKNVLKITLPNVTGAVNPTQTELNYVVGVTSLIQTQLNAKAPLASPALTGTPTAPTAAVGTNTTQLATTAFAAALGMSAALPAQLGNSGKYVTTDGTTASWVAVSADLIYTARSTNTQLVAADFAFVTRKFIDITSGTFTQTFAAAATIGANGWLYIRNSGTGYITIPLSDGVTNWIMYPGEIRLFQCDGIVFRSAIVKSFYYSTQTSALLDDRGIDRAWLIGHSLGGSIALWGAHLMGDRISGVTCVNAGGGIYLKEEFETFRNAGQQMLKFRPKWLANVPLLDRVFAQASACQNLGRAWGRQRLVDFVSADFTAAKGSLLESTTEAEVHRLPQLVSELQQPVHFIAGDLDRIMEPRYVRHLASFHPKFQQCNDSVLELTHCGHFAMVEYPDRVGNAIRNAIAQAQIKTP